MNDIVKTYQERFRRSRHEFRRYAALLLALAMITTLFVNWQLHGVGISMTADYQCGEQEHTHTADCYEKVLVCGYEEGEIIDPGTVSEPDDAAEDDSLALYEAEPEYIFVPHEHTADCYTEVQTLTCMEEEHVHDDDCFDPEDGSLICDKFEHIHDESCYTTDYELTCGLEDGELVEELNPNYTPVAAFEASVVVEPVAEPVVHHHTDDCYEEVLVCPFPEHHHTVNCLSDQTADVEDEAEWLAQTDTTLDGFWSDDLISVAKSQLGYEQSEKNFQLDGDDGVTVRHYTRYGQWYGNPYGEWDVMFLAYCLNYAQIPQTAVPQTASVLALRSAMSSMEWLLNGADGSAAAPGDIVIYSKNQMDTVVWEQPEISDDTADSDIAVYSSGYTPSKPVVVDPDFTAPTAPTPVYTTQTTTVDTVGIVTDVDEELGMLTVVSGDVDGKVAEVQLSFGEVESVISVVSAQMALQGGTTTLEGKTLEENWVTDTTIVIDGTEYVVKDNGDDIDIPGLTITDDTSVGLYYKFSIPSDANLPAGTNTLTYQLPKGFHLDKAGSAALEDENNKKIGTITVSEDGQVTLTFDQDLSGRQISGHFYVECKVDKKTSTNQDEIKFPGNGTTIKVESKTDLSLSKDAKITGKTDDGKYIIHYVVKAKSTNGSGKPIDLSDYLRLDQSGSSFSDAEYRNISLRLNNTKWTQGVDYEVKNITNNGNPGIQITDKNGDSLPALNEGQTYVLEYDVVVDRSNADQNGANFYNTATANDEVKDHNIYFHNEMSKSGSYDPKTGLITWTITIMPNGASMKNYVLKDTLLEGCKMDGYFVITDHNGTKIVEKDDFCKDQGSFSYDFGKDFDDSKYNNYSYKVTYKTTAPANFKIGDTVTNNAELDLNGNKEWGTSGDATYYDRNQSSSKTALDDKNLTDDRADNNIFTLHWKLSVTVPAKWPNDEITIKDSIKEPSVSSGSSDGMEHYAIKSTLEKEIKEKLELIREDGTTIPYNKLAENGLSVEITYYSGHDYNGITVTDDNGHVGSFTLTFKKDASFTGSPIETIVINKYTTLGDATGFEKGQTITFKNEANGSSDEYHYTIPADKNKELIKMAADKAPDSKESSGFYEAGNDVKVSYNNGKDGTYIYYQLKLVTQNDPIDLPATITDQLPKYVTYVPGSAYLVIGRGNGTQIDAYHTTAQVNNGSIKDPDINNGNYQDGVDISSDHYFGCTLDTDTNTLTFTLKDPLKCLGYPSPSDTVAYLIRYAVKVDDNLWDMSKESETKVFANSATWEGVGPSDTKTTVERKSSLLIKSGVYNYDTDGTNTVTYSVIINPDKLKIGDEDMITLTDEMRINGRNDNAASLVDGSVKLYSYNAATGQRGAALPSGSYDVDYKEGTNSSNTSKRYILTVKVPNAQTFLLEYTYKNTSNTDYEMKNQATLSGYTTTEVVTKVEHVTMGGGAHTVGLTIQKVDSKNISIPLAGAKFKLERFDPQSGEYVTVHDVLDAKDDSPSEFYLSFSDSGDTSSGDGSVLRPFNTLYRLTETEAPDGYKCDKNWAHYFIWTTDVSSEQSAYSVAVGNYGSDKTGVKQSDISFYHKDESITLKVLNESSRLTVQKVWYDKDGNSLDENDPKLPTQITVELWKHKTTDWEADPGEKVTTLTLTAPDWSASYTIPAEDADYYYYVKEVSTGKAYNVTYRNNNVQGNGTIVLTNTETENNGYELPSTGGAGTTPFTAVGGTMMLAALVYGVRRKRRNEGRAED